MLSTLGTRSVTAFLTNTALVPDEGGDIIESTPDDRRQIGILSASALIFNRVIGTGIFATPSTILALTGSVGLSLFMWVAGTAIAMAGTAVYLEWGTAIPKYACLLCFDLSSPCQT